MLDPTANSAYPPAMPPANPAGGNPAMGNPAMGGAVGGDMPNTMPVAIQGGLQAGKLARPMLDAAKAGTKLPKDQFLSSVKNNAVANVPLADAMQQQSFIVRLAAKLPYMERFLGPDFIVNKSIAGLSKQAMGKANSQIVTRIALEGGDDVAQKLMAAGVTQEGAEAVAKAAAERAAKLGLQTAGQATQQGARQAAAGLSDDAIQKAVGEMGKYGGGLKATVDAVPVGHMNNIREALALGGDDAVAALQKQGFLKEAAQKLVAASATEGVEAAAAQGAQQAVQQGAKQAVAGISNEAIQEAIKGFGNANGFLASAKSAPTMDTIRQVLTKGGDEAFTELTKLGMRQDAAKKLIETAAKEGTESVATQATQQVATEVAKEGVEEASKQGILGSAKGLLGKVLGGAKGNFVIAGVFSLASNAVQLATGQMNVKQFVALTGMDTLAYGAIGLGSAAAGGAIAGAIGQVLIPIPGLGFLCGLGVGIAGGLIYEKLLRNPVKNLLGGSGDEPAYDPGASPQDPNAPMVDPGQVYQDPYQVPPTGQPGQSPLDPSAQAPQTPPAPQTPARPPAPPPPPPLRVSQEQLLTNPNGLSYEEALAQLNTYRQ